MRALLALLLCVSHAQYFRSGYKQATGATPVLVASCDLSGDGVNDFAVTNYNSNDGQSKKRGGKKKKRKKKRGEAPEAHMRENAKSNFLLIFF